MGGGVPAQRRRRQLPLGVLRRPARADRRGAAAALRRHDAREERPAPPRAAQVLRRAAIAHGRQARLRRAEPLPHRRGDGLPRAARLGRRLRRRGAARRQARGRRRVAAARHVVVTSPSGAQFSRCRRWRYLLWRCWDAKRPAANFLMLNPSTADEVKLDPSCTRARDYALRWGFGGLLVTNIFAWRATDPQEMKAARDPVGRGNDRAILRAAREAAIVVCAWGNHGTHMNR
ncbi:MAG: DUF1643 domain-containing protein, partial [Betaproteobacteria bacterium]